MRGTFASASKMFASKDGDLVLTLGQLNQSRRRSLATCFSSTGWQLFRWALMFTPFFRLMTCSPFFFGMRGRGRTFLDHRKEQAVQLVAFTYLFKARFLINSPHASRFLLLASCLSSFIDSRVHQYTEMKNNANKSLSPLVDYFYKCFD